MRSALILAVTLCLGLAACGVKGDLQPPPAKNAPPVEKQRTLF